MASSTIDFFAGTSGLSLACWFYTEGLVWRPASASLVAPSTLTASQLTAALTNLTEQQTSDAVKNGNYPINFASVTSLTASKSYDVLVVAQGASPSASPTGLVSDCFWDGTYVATAGGGATLANQTAILAKLNTSQITTAAPVTATGSITLVQGDDYLAADGRNLSWTVKNWSGPAVGTLTVTFKLMTAETYQAGGTTVALTKTGSVTASGSDALFKVDLSRTDTAALSPVPPATVKWNYVYQLLATTSGGDVLTQALGACTVIANAS